MKNSVIRNKICETAKYVVNEMGSDTIKDFKGVRSCKVKSFFDEDVIDLESSNSSKPECVIITAGVFYTSLPIFRHYLMKHLDDRCALDELSNRICRIIIAHNNYDECGEDAQMVYKEGKSIMDAFYKERKIGCWEVSANGFGYDPTILEDDSTSTTTMGMYTNENPLKVFTTFSGYDSQCLALKKAGIPFELVGWSEIENRAIVAHNALFPEYKDRNYGDICKIDWENVPDFDFFTYSSPCTSFDARRRGGLWNAIFSLVGVQESY